MRDFLQRVINRGHRRLPDDSGADGHVPRELRCRTACGAGTAETPVDSRSGLTVGTLYINIITDNVEI